MAKVMTQYVIRDKLRRHWMIICDKEYGWIICEIYRNVYSWGRYSVIGGQTNLKIKPFLWTKKSRFWNNWIMKMTSKKSKFKMS